MLRIEPVPPGLQERALRLLTGPGRRHRDAFAAMLAAHDPDDVRLWWARRLRRPRAAAATVRGAGRTAMMFASPAGESDPAALVRLLEELTEAALGEGLTYVQVLLEPDLREDADAFLRAGYAFLAQLVYLRRGLQRLPPPPSGELSWRTFRPGDEVRLGQVIADTYVGSRDCPRLLGLRPMPDVVAAHRACGTFRPEWWWMPATGGDCVGCALVNGVAGRPDAADVVYLGVRPHRRRQGFGRAMIRKALHAAADQGVAEMHLAVDAENDAAFALYLQEGFVEIDRKDVYIRARGSRP